MAYRASMLNRSLCLPAQRGICNALGMSSSSLLTNLVAYYKFADANDSHTNALSLTEVNSPTYVAGQVANCVNLVAASNQYLSRATNQITGSTSSLYTLMGWVRFTSLPASRMGVIGQNNDQYSIAWHGDLGTPYLKAGVRNAGGTYHDFGTFVPVINTWYHLAFVIDAAGTSTFYVDGVSVGTRAALTGGLLVSTASMFWGIGRGGGSLDGRIDEWGVWSTGLTQTQRDNVRTAQLAGSGSYPFAGIP